MHSPFPGRPAPQPQPQGVGMSPHSHHMAQPFQNQQMTPQQQQQAVRERCAVSYGMLSCTDRPVRSQHRQAQMAQAQAMQAQGHLSRPASASGNHGSIQQPPQRQPSRAGQHNAGSPHPYPEMPHSSQGSSPVNTMGSPMKRQRRLTSGGAAAEQQQYTAGSPGPNQSFQLPHGMDQAQAQAQAQAQQQQQAFFQVSTCTLS